MKRLLVISLILGLFVGLVAMSGCGKKETTVKLPGGEEVEVQEDGGKVTVETEEGETTYESGEEEPTERELGVPIYPDADYVAGSGGTASATSEGETTVYAGGEWTTEDDFDEVVDWYANELGAPTYTSSEGGTKSAAWIIGDEENVTTVNITEEDGEVTITIGKIGG